MPIERVSYRRVMADSITPDEDLASPAEVQPVSSENETTRRAWMATIGYASAGLGLTQTMRARADTSALLPPGLYFPSKDHLDHALVYSEQFHPIPASCPVDYITPPTGPFKPQFFSPPEFPAIRRLVQLILGE